jgi:hypothetical protein
VHDLAHPLSKLIVLGAKAEAGAGDVATHGHHALCVRMIDAEQRAQRVLQPSRDVALVRTAHERIHAAVGALQITDQ